MATADPSTTVLPDAVTDAVVPDRYAETVDTLATAVRGAAFWSGIALAFAQVPLLVAGVTATRPALFAGLLAVNVLAMAVGSGYRA